MKKESLLVGTACFFAGVVAGFMIAPIKNGIVCGNNNGNNNYVNGGDEELEEAEEVDGEEALELSYLNKQLKLIIFLKDKLLIIFIFALNEFL